MRTKTLLHVKDFFIPFQLLFQRAFLVGCLPETMSLAFEEDVLDSVCASISPDRLDHSFALIRRDDLVEIALLDQHRRDDPVCHVQRRAIMVNLRHFFRRTAQQSKRVPRFELMRVGSERSQFRDTVARTSSRENFRVQTERCEDRVAA